MATYAARQGKAGGNARAVHAGANVVVSNFVWGVTNLDDATTSSTAAATDVIRFAKLPKGAVVTSVVIVGNRDDGSYNIGTSTSASRFGALISASAGITTMTIGLPYTVSISDEASVYYEWLQATVLSAGYTLSDQIQCICTYTMDP